MFDYRVVCVYPLERPNEGLEGLDASVVEDLERSIASSIEDGWEYVYTTSYSQGAPVSHRTSSGIRTFVYRKMRVNVEMTDGERTATVSNVFASMAEAETETEALAAEEQAPELPPTVKSHLTLALLNALYQHKEIEPETVLSDLCRNGEISEDERRTLAARMAKPISAKMLADMTPPELSYDVYRLSVMPFSDEDHDYITYLAELAVYLGIDEPTVAATTQHNRQPVPQRRAIG